MRGSTRRRGSTWTAYWDVDPDPITGGRRQKSKGGFRRQKDAEAHLATVITSVNDGTYSEPSKTSLAAFLTGEWLPAVRSQLRPSSQYTYERIIRTHIERRDIGAVPLRALSPGHVNKLYGELEDAGLALATRRLVHAMLHRALQDAVRWERLRRNPAALAAAPAMPRSRAQSWTAGETRRFLKHVRDDRQAALWRLGVTTGMRRGELLGLPWLEVDGTTVRVTQQLTPATAPCDVCGRVHSTLGPPPKSYRGERTITLDKDTAEAIERHRAVQLAERDLAGDAYQDHDLVFADELGFPIDPRRLTERFVAHRAAAKISVGTMHTLRHTSATLALTAGVPLHVVAARLGDDPKTVLRHYAHLLPHSDAAAADAIAAQIVDKSWTDSDRPGAKMAE